jgi:AraC-like DNA-binding protein
MRKRSLSLRCRNDGSLRIRLWLSRHDGSKDAFATWHKATTIQIDIRGEQIGRRSRVAAMLKADPADRRPLAELASAAGASHRTIERLFASETRMSFGRWRIRHRMITALEKLANGDTVGNVAYAVGYESPSSFVAAFRDTFGTTPTSYFENVRNQRSSKPVQRGGSSNGSKS